MAYATQTDLQQFIPPDRLLALTDDTDNGAVDASVVEAALETASETIDSYLSERYGLPLASPPGILKRLCCQVAGYDLHVRRDEVSDNWQAQYDNAIKMLEKVGTGSLKIGISTDSEEEAADNETMQIITPDKLFSEDELEKY